MTSDVTNSGVQIQVERRRLKRELTLLPLFGLIYFTVCGGSFGIEPLVGWSGPGLAMLLVVITPLVFSLPNLLMVRELQSMMPVEGGYYHWVKQGFGPFAGYMAGWMNWVVSWVDVSIYPILAAYYLGYFIPALREGATIGGITLSAGLLSFFVAALLIWLISLLQMRGAKLAGLTAGWLGVVMLIPLILMSIVGLLNWIRAGSTPTLPFLAGNSGLTAALSTGLFVVMWNYMGWELPSAAGDEIVNPRKTYPRAMVLVLVAAIATYLIPLVTGLYGGAADDGRYAIWGIEEYSDGEGIGVVAADYGVTPEQFAAWGVDPSSPVGWEFPDIAHRLGEVASGGNNGVARCLGLSVTFAAVLSMIGLFIGNSLGGTRVPFALAEDGMMPTMARACPSEVWHALGGHPLLRRDLHDFLAASVRGAGRDRCLSADAGHPDGVRGAVEVPPHAARCAAREGAGRLRGSGARHARPDRGHLARDLQPGSRGGSEFARDGAGGDRGRRAALPADPQVHQAGKAGY